MRTKHAPSKFGELLFKFRSSRQISGARICSMAGISKGYYSELENSRRIPPKPLHVLKIAEALELSDLEKSALLLASSRERCSSQVASLFPSFVAEYVDAVLAESSVLTADDVQALRASFDSLLVSKAR